MGRNTNSVNSGSKPGVGPNTHASTQARDGQKFARYPMSHRIRLDSKASACFHSGMKNQRTPAPEGKTAPTRDRILECATQLFSVHGFEAMTMRMLGQAVGLDNSSIYRHFRSKSELADAVLDQAAGSFLKALGPHMDATRPASLEALEDAAAAAGLHFFERQSAARLMLHWIMSTGTGGPGFGVSVPATDTARPGGRLLALVRKWLADGARQGKLRKHAMPDAIVLLLGIVLVRPATYGHLLASMEPRRTRNAALMAWEKELRAAVRGAFAP